MYLRALNESFVVKYITFDGRNELKQNMIKLTTDNITRRNPTFYY